MVNPISKIQFAVCGKKNYQRKHGVRFLCREPHRRNDGKEDYRDEDILDIELVAWKMYFDGVVK